MHVVVTARVFLARRPWVYWVVVAALTALVVVIVRDRLTAIDAQRESWGATQTVLIADHGLEPDDPIDVSRVDVPLAILPPGAITDLPPDARLRQHVAAGEILVDIDIRATPGPAGGADVGTVVVAVSEPRSRSLTTGLAVQVTADGIILAERATIVDLADDVVFVAVDPADAAAVAAANRADLATLLFLP